MVPRDHERCPVCGEWCQRNRQQIEELERVLGDSLTDYNRRMSSRRGRILLWLLRKTT
jgi:hypothetical protein